MPKYFQPADTAPLYSAYPLDYQIPTAMAAYLREKNDLTPPLAGILAELGQSGNGKIGVIKAGNLQDDPTVVGGVVTLHVGDIQDPTWTKERFTGGRADSASGLGRQARLYSVYDEFGGGGVWWYRYTCALQYHATGDTQELAALKATILDMWLRDKIGAATPNLLGLTLNGFEVAQDFTVMGASANEAGGPSSSYLWRVRIHFQSLVHVER